MRAGALSVLGFIATPLLFIGFAQSTAALLDRDLERWSRHDAAHELARSVFVAVDLYRRDHQRVPDEAAGLQALVPGYIRNVPDDPWGNPLLYQVRGADWADVISLGADAAPGGRGAATDVSARYGSPGTSAPRSLNFLLLLLLAAVPAVGFAASRLHGAGRPFLVGVALFWGFAVSATIAPDADLSLLLIAAFAAVSTAFTGAVLCLRRASGGPAIALAGALACEAAAAWMMRVIS